MEKRFSAAATKGRLFSPHGMKLLPCAMALGLAACANIPSEAPKKVDLAASTTDTKTAVGFAQFSDIAVPAGSKMDVDRTLVLGARDSWIGRLSISNGESVTDSYDFFLREMGKYGWQEITTVRSEVSVLTYSRSDRIATIQIRPRVLGGSLVDITVSPRDRRPATPTGGPIEASPIR